MKLEDLRISILGMARSGVAAADLAARLGARVFISEYKQRENTPEANAIAKGFECEFGGHSDRVLDADLLVTSPGVPRDADILVRAQAAGVEVISEIEFGYRAMHPRTSLVAITGSNGKSTTTALTAHLLRACGLNAREGGNIGAAMCGLPLETGELDVAVIEISSFQLEWVEQLRPNVAMVLNITPDHLNRYHSFDDYAGTKLRIFGAQTCKDTAILPRDDEVINRLIGRLQPTLHNFAPDVPADAYVYNGHLVVPAADWNLPHRDLPLQGPHNKLNMLAALLAVHAISQDHPGVTQEAVLDGLRSFKPLEHRLEPVAEIDGVRFVNDSKATNTDSVRYALQSYSNPLRLIMGGSDKGEDFSPLLSLLLQHAIKLYLIGETADTLEKAFGRSMACSRAGSLEEAVRAAFADAKSGDIVLLSPACASYDMFDNFEHRGRAFKEVVRKLAGEKHA